MKTVYRDGVPRVLPEGEIQAVIFDFDGTLVDSEPNYFKAYTEVLADFGISYDMTMFNRFVGRGNLEVAQILRDEYRLTADVPKFLSLISDAYMAHARRESEIFPEMRKLLDCCVAAGLKLGIASGSAQAMLEELSDILGIRPMFGAILSSEKVARGKPAPDVFLETARLLSVAPERCLVLEDSPYGITAARRAGMRCVGIPTVHSAENDRVFRESDLYFPGGQAAFTADEVLDWCNLRRGVGCETATGRSARS